MPSEEQRDRGRRASPRGMYGNHTYPGLVWGCLVWDDPGRPGMVEAFAHWEPLH